ncbi:hypothetical protein GpartN1_g4579.t1 [Galdieria partita]|uniref:Uncharacterized protein n=1 Tax=Galdieria partita TaxID=83374 RepID=A0A9C7URC6_9RHOD|nr:hypothetical protein GpartN1_g4579.t1 [Galdieria partita]
MVVTRRSRKVGSEPNKGILEASNNKSKKSAKASVLTEKSPRKVTKTKRSNAINAEPMKELATLSKERLKELITSLPATVIERLEHRGVERGQWKVYVSVSDTTPLFCVTQEDSLLASVPK